MSNVKSFDFGAGNTQQKKNSSKYGKFRALVIDDFDSFRITVSRMLSEFGVGHVDTAVKASQALQMCKAGKYDIILCDHNLGMGQTGQQLLEELRQKQMLKYSSIFLMVSAESSKSVVLAAYEYEPDAYLTKPLTQQALNQRLSKLFVSREALQPINQALDDDNLQQAVDLCKSVAASHPKFRNQCLKIMSETMLKLGDVEGVEALASQVLNAHPVEWARLALCQARFQLKQYEGLPELLDEVLASNPLCMPAYDLKSEVYRALNQKRDEQKTLQAAVKISPLAINRQKSLGSVALENNDVEAAAQAYQRTVRLGDNSCYDSIENHINFGRTTASMFDVDENRARELSKEAIKSLDTLASRFGHDQELDIQSKLLNAQLNFKTGSKRKAEDLLGQVELEMDDLPFEPELGTHLDLVETFKALGQQRKSEDALAKVLEHYDGDQKSLQLIDRHLEEPVSDEARKEVAAVNKKGIQLFKSQEFEEAIECFSDARQRYPKHVVIALNMVQTLVAAMESEGERKDYIDLAVTALAAASKIPNNHPQHARMRQLQDKIKRLDGGK